jgi:hypothetical protein
MCTGNADYNPAVDPKNYTPNRNDVPVYAGQWYKMEFYIKKSSVYGAKDGALKWWIDGVLVGDYPNVVLGSYPFTEWHGDPVWGGSTAYDANGKPIHVKPRDEYMWFDHIYLSGR